MNKNNSKEATDGQYNCINSFTMKCDGVVKPIKSKCSNKENALKCGQMHQKEFIFHSVPACRAGAECLKPQKSVFH